MNEMSHRLIKDGGNLLGKKNPIMDLQNCLWVSCWNFAIYCCSFLCSLFITDFKRGYSSRNEIFVYVHSNNTGKKSVSKLRILKRDSYIPQVFIFTFGSRKFSGEICVHCTIFPLK